MRSRNWRNQVHAHDQQWRCIHNHLQYLNQWFSTLAALGKHWRTLKNTDAQTLTPNSKVNGPGCSLGIGIFKELSYKIWLPVTFPILSPTTFHLVTLPQSHKPPCPLLNMSSLSCTSLSPPLSPPPLPVWLSFSFPFPQLRGPESQLVIPSPPWLLLEL